MKEVKIIADGAAVKLPSGAVQKYPVGWIGAVDPAIADVWLQHGLAETTVVEKADLTPEQKRVLAAAADEIIAQVAAAHAAEAEAAEVEAGEIDAADLEEPTAEDVPDDEAGDLEDKAEGVADSSASAGNVTGSRRRR